MTTRERLIQEISQIPEEIVEELLDFLLFTQARSSYHFCFFFKLFYNSFSRSGV